MPNVSIIIATHSRPHLLPRAIASAQNAGANVEVIVVDDASRDETAELCRAIKGIVYVRSEENLRTAGARNLGIRASTAPYVCFLDDDDLRLPNSIDAQVSLLDEHPDAAVVYGGYHVSDQEGTIMDTLSGPDWCREGDLFWNLLQICHIGCLTAVFRKDNAYEVGLLDERFPGVDDWDLWVRLAENHKFRAVSEPVAIWRSPSEFSGQGSSNLSNLFQMGSKLLANKWLDLPRVRRELTFDEIKKKKHDILMSFSDHILFDMRATTGTRRKVEKVAGAVRMNPALLETSYLYKALTLELLSSLGIRTRK